MFFYRNLKKVIFGVLGLHCGVRAFSSCSKREPHCSAGASHCSGVSRGAQALGALASVVVAHRLSHSAACKIFPYQGPPALVG